jgi:hypothetical protein
MIEIKAPRVILLTIKILQNLDLIHIVKFYTSVLVRVKNRFS